MKISMEIKESTKEELEKMRKLVGAEFKLSDGSNLYYKGGDCFLVYPNGRLLLLLEFKLIKQKRNKFIDIKKCLLCDEGINK